MFGDALVDDLGRGGVVACIGHLAVGVERLVLVGLRPGLVVEFVVRVSVVDVADDTEGFEFLGTVGVVHLQTALAALGGDDEVDRRAHEQQGGGEDVDADAGDEGVRGVRAQEFDDESACTVPGHVQCEQSAVTDAESPVENHEHENHEHVPHQLVQEGGVDDLVHLTGRGPVDQVGSGLDAVGALVDLQPPRHRCRSAVELLVEVVAQPPDRLGEQDRGRDGIAERGQPDTVTARTDPRAEGTEDHRTPDSETAVPDLEDVDRGLAAAAEVDRPVGEDVIDTATDQTEGHCPDGNVEDFTGLAAACDPAAIPPPDRDDDADDDAQRIRPQRDRPEMPDPLRRTGDIGEQRRRRRDHGHTLTDRRRHTIAPPGRFVRSDVTCAGHLGGFGWATPSASSRTRSRS